MGCAGAEAGAGPGVPGSAAAGEVVLDDSDDCCVEDALSGVELVAVAPRTAGPQANPIRARKARAFREVAARLGRMRGVTTRSSSVSSRRSRHARGSRIVLGLSPGLMRVFPRGQCRSTSRLAARTHGFRDSRETAARGKTGGTRRPRRCPRRTALRSDGAHGTGSAAHPAATADALCSTDDAGSPLRDRCNARTRKATVNQTTQSRRFSAAKPRT